MPPPSLQAVLNRPKVGAMKRRRPRKQVARAEAILSMTPEQVATVKNKLYANWLIRRLVANGELPKAQTRVCELCGAAQAVDWHHEDYTRPRSVIALCHPCHEQADRARREWERDGV
jgi:hypothetical protein